MQKIVPNLWYRGSKVSYRLNNGSNTDLNFEHLTANACRGKNVEGREMNRTMALKHATYYLLFPNQFNV